MKKFKFRLETVLDIKNKKLKDKQLELSEILNLLQEEETKLEHTLNLKTATQNDLVALYQKQEELDISEITGIKNYLVRLDLLIVEQQAKVEEVKQKVELKKQEVNEAYKEFKVLDKLKEKQEKQFYKEYYDKQAKEIDDITTSRY